MEFDISTLAYAIALITIIYWFFGRRGNKPPGPWGLPFIGYLPFLTKNPHIKLTELKKKYGPLFSVQLGSKYVVALNDYQTIRDAFQQDAFMGRPADMVFNLNKETIALEAITGMNWREQRRFSLHSLRDLGFGKSRMEQHIHEEILEVLEFLKKDANRPIFVRKLLTASMSNNIASLVFGRRMKYDDPDRILLDKTFNEVAQFAGSLTVLIFLPWLKPIFSFLRIGNQSKLNKALAAIKGFIRKEIAEHRRTLDPNNVRDFVDGYLLEAEKKKSDPETTFIDPVLEDIVGAFFGAGSVTVRITTEWLLLVAASFQEVQKKVQEEIANAVGSEGFLTRADYNRMPYTEAVILELMRWRTILAVDLSRFTLEDTTLNSYSIPKQTYVANNLWAVHHDEKLWGNDVDIFKPERFLSEDGSEVRKPEYFIPFSVGKRSCPGEPLAKVEVFMYFTSILQKFNVKLPSGAKPNFDGVLGIALDPVPQELIFEPRA